jgi:hypothetical protein
LERLLVSDGGAQRLNAAVDRGARFFVEVPVMARAIR